MGSMEEAIRRDPDRFMVDMDLRRIFDKATFDAEVENAKLGVSHRYYKNMRWTRSKDTLYNTPEFQHYLKTTTADAHAIKVKTKGGAFTTIKGYDLGDGTFLMTKNKKLKSGKIIKYRVRRIKKNN